MITHLQFIKNKTTAKEDKHKTHLNLPLNNLQ